jgi:hypothetical protein
MQYSAASGLEIVPTLDAKLPFYTAASTIFIGHNPNTGVTAPAGTEIDFLFVDPPNHGND